MFKAKNIKIKRSKTKLEDELPIPNMNAFQSEKDRLNIGLIAILSSFLIELSNSRSTMDIDGFKNKVHELEDDMKSSKDDLFPSLYSALKRKDGIFVQKIVDNLFFQLFNIREKEIDYLINKYYHL